MRLSQKLAATLGVGGVLVLGAGAGATLASTGASQAAKMPTHRAVAAVSGGSVSVLPGQNRLATVACPAGFIVTGGGGATTGIRIYFTDSFPSGNGWAIRGTNTGTTTLSLTAVARCLRLTLTGA